MASSSRTISQTVWEAQKETILHLRFTEGLPLSNNKNGGRTVMQVMREDHQFEATQSQYEQQLKRWGAAKHMKQSDWKSILPIYSRLKQRGLSPRIRLGETVLDERRVIKAQRRYFGQSDQVRIVSTTPRMSFAQNNLLRLDVRQHSGEYVEYSEFDATFNAELIPTLTAPVQPATANSHRQDQNIQDSQMLETGSRSNPTLVPEIDMQNDSLPIEVHLLSGEHLEYSEFNEVFNAGRTSGLTVPVQPTNITRNAQFQALQNDPTLASGSLSRFATLSPGLDIFRPNTSPLDIKCDDGGISLRSVMQQPLSPSDPGIFLESFALMSPARSVTHVNERIRTPGLTRSIRLLFKPYVDSILDSISPDIEQTENEFGNINAQMIATRLEHLLFEDSGHASKCTSSLMSQISYAVSQLPRIVISCFVNNLAGLDEFPLCLLFGLIKADANVRESLLSGLRSSNVIFATALLDCALRSAIRAGDEDILAIILEVTKGNITKIDLNSTVYRFNDKQCSPLGLAAILCYPGVVQKLLNFGAKVDVGALNEVVWEWYDSPTDRNEKRDARHQIIGIFLANGASADCTALKRVLKSGFATGSTLISLIRTTFGESHWEVFRNLGKGYFASVMKEYACVETLFFEFSKICQSMGCSDICKSAYADIFDKILRYAITDGNIELASSVLDHVQPTVWSLTAAIRTKCFEMIQVLLSKRIDIDGCARRFENLAFDYNHHNCGSDSDGSRDDDHDDHGNDYDNCNCTPLIDGKKGWYRPTTPLAEAILWRNQDLISTLEECGALDGVRDGTPGHLTAALVAAVRVGDVPLLKSLLRLGGACNFYDDLEVAIAEAIWARNVEMTKILFMRRMNKDASMWPRSPDICHLLIALKRRVYEIVFFLLEYGEDSREKARVVLEAVRWGDEAVIECMHDLEFFQPATLPPLWWVYPPPVSALGEAMAAGNAELVNRLLNWGADPSDHIPVAITIGDENMVRFLLDQGGKASGVEQAISNGRYSILELLLDRGAAPVWLEQTIESGRHDMMCSLLRYGADPADDGAFSVALLCDDRSFLSTLSDAFSSRYPNGKRGFGVGAFETALVHCDTSVLEQLLDLQLDVNGYRPAYPHWTPNILHIAIQQAMEGAIFGGVVHKCNPNGCKGDVVRRTDSEWEEIQTLLLDAGADTEKVSAGLTALLCAINTRRIQTVKLLLDRDINVNRPVKRGLRRTPLQQACEMGDFEIIKLLLGKGASVNAAPAMNGGATALQLAAIKGSQRIVRLLLDEGADIHGPKATFNGRTALEGAAEHGRLSILNTLLTEGASGFGADEIEGAMALAENEGHRGCVERLKLALYRLSNDHESPLSLRL
ncbi:unnamed protein product [Clonostachys rhizophaga]|uniref:Clr5 domain-containing protein n=1 Tax=Clonostachys rhizophaga TaxID=160324 RepID=A0A9N9VQR8_9HYPO|nr:unnamed protein product [Clonostachys rhizophaga]